MTLTNTFKAVLLCGALLATLSACEKQGTMEKAGQSMDEAAEKTADKVEEIGDDVKEAVSGEAN